MNKSSRNIYETFPDGWDFTPDVGNGQTRGEVFTPLWVINKMVSDAGIIPETAVYDFDYTSLSIPEALKVVRAKVVEPGVGSGNYTSVILYHKLRYAGFAAKDDRNLLKQYVLEAVASIYAFDIDAGNLETTRRRILGELEKDSSKPLNSKETITFYVDYLYEKLHEGDYRKSQYTEKDNLTKIVSESLLEAQNNWFKKLEKNKFSGVIDSFWEEKTGEKLTLHLQNFLSKILEENLKLFNGIEEEDTVSEDFCVPGWKNIYWAWWSFEVDDNGVITSKVKPVSLAKQIYEARLEEEARKLGVQPFDFGL
jgi:hypothetical protein